MENMLQNRFCRKVTFSRVWESVSHCIPDTQFLDLAQKACTGHIPEWSLLPLHHRDCRDTVEAGGSSTTRVLYARYTSGRCVRSTMGTTCVSLQMSDVRWLNTSAFFGSSAKLTVIGPTCRHAMAKSDRKEYIPDGDIDKLWPPCTSLAT